MQPLASKKTAHAPVCCVTNLKPTAFGLQKCALHCEGEKGGNMSSDLHIIPFTSQEVPRVPRITNFPLLTARIKASDIVQQVQ